jgi:hypothetical protein
MRKILTHGEMRIQSTDPSKIINGRHTQRSDQHILFRRKNIQKVNTVPTGQWAPAAYFSFWTLCMNENLCSINIYGKVHGATRVVRSVADPDPGSGAFLTPGSGIGFFRIPDPGSRISDPGSQTHIFESILKIFG